VKTKSPFALSIIYLLLISPSCGIKGPPRPPTLVTPAAVADLSGISRENNVTLTWTKPPKNTDGSPLKDLASFKLYRNSILIATINAERPENALVEGNRYVFQDQALKYEHRYFYQLISLNKRGLESPPSNKAIIEVTVPPVAPTNLRAEAGEGIVTLSWEAPKVKADGTALTELKGYNIYRGEHPGTYNLRPINPELIRETRYLDLGLSNDKTYYYMVRAVDREGPPLHEGLDSQEVSATPLDMTPPAPPRGLKAVVGEKAVHLIWDPNPEGDLLGYYVYRSLIPGRGYHRLTPVPLPKVTFTDDDVRPKTTYYYVITAVDASSRQNESAPSEETSVETP